MGVKKITLHPYAAITIRLVWALLLLWVSRFLFYFLNRDHFPAIEPAEWGSILFGGLRFDVAAICYVNALYVLLQVLPLSFRYHEGYKKTARLIYVLTNSFALLANCADMVYFPFTLRRTTASVLKEFSHEGNLGTILFNSSLHYWYVFVLFLFLVYLLVVGYNSVEVKKPSSWRPLPFYAGSVGMLLLFPFLFVGGIRGDWRYSTRPMTMSNAGQYVKQPSQVALVLNTPFCIIRTLTQQFYKEESFYTEPQLSQLFSPVVQFNTSRSFRYENVVILVLESFGRESVGFFNKQLDGGAYKGYTPFLDSLLSKSLVYEYGFATGRKSIDALPAVLTGIPAGELPFVLTPYASNDLESLPFILGQQGYHTSFFHGAPNGSMGFQAFMNLIGVQHYFGKTEYGNDADFDGTWGIWDEPFLQFFAKKLDSFPEPFQTTLFTVSSHEPFVVPPQYKGVFPKGEHPIREVTGYTDMALRKFFTAVQHKPWFKRTLFVLTADHASLSSHPAYQTAWGNMAIPILFYHPSDSLQAFRPGIIQQTDIMPSILGYLGYTKPIIAFGKNIFEPNHPDRAINYHDGFQLFQGDFLLRFNGTAPAALYRFKEDPLLANNLLLQQGKVVTSMQQTLTAFIQQYHNRLIRNQLRPPKP